MKTTVKKKKRLAVNRTLSDEISANTPLWDIVRQLAFLACAIDAGVDLKEHKPYAIDLVNAAKAAYADYFQKEGRSLDERMIAVVTNELKEIYKLARSKRWTEEKLSVAVSDLANQYEVTFKLTAAEVQTLSKLPTQRKWDDKRGPMELAVDNMSFICTAQPSTIYGIMKAHKSYFKRNQQGVEFIDFIDLRNFKDQLLLGLGLSQKLSKGATTPSKEGRI